MISTLIYEEWKPIKGYEKFYETSSFGRVRSLKFGKMRVLKPIKTKCGYLQVQLYKDGKYKCFLIHRLVWEAFNGEIPEGMEVNHINEDKTDCSLSNLNLLTHKANSDWGTRTQRIKEKLAEKLSDPVLQLTLDDVLVKEWPSMHEAGRNGFDHVCISLCCNGKLKKHKGFLWRKKESVL